MSEPWHWRYVGVEVATDMHNKAILTLEEYFNVEGGGYKEDPTPVEPPVVTPPQDPQYDVNFIVAFFNAVVAVIKDFFNKNKKK
jgi:hypothetical protein